MPAIERMFEKDISEKDVESVINHAVIVETYPNDLPYPSYLILGNINDIAIHVVYSKDDDNNIIVITVYKPNLKKWQAGYKERIG